LSRIGRLLHIIDKPSRLVIGLMSGTSVDGIDAVLVRIEGHGASAKIEPIAFHSYPFPPDLRARVFRLFDPKEARVDEICHLDFLLGEVFAAAVDRLLADCGRAHADVDLVASAGQTIWHAPRPVTEEPGADWIDHPLVSRSTLAIGQSAVIAERTGITTIGDLRVRDVAAGGEGAPLVPLVDHLLFRKPGRRRALQNIGGIANVTLVSDRLDDLVAFDNGPGNMPLDTVARAASAGSEAFDRDGLRAARGDIDVGLLTELHRHPYLSQPLPKSTGREVFGKDFVYPLLARYHNRHDDLLATLTRFSAEAIARSYREMLPKMPDEVFVSGGGALNPTLMRHLSELLAPIPVTSSAVLGVDPEAKEAIAFAVLANQTLFGAAGNIPAVTGAIGPRVLGKLSF